MKIAHIIPGSGGSFYCGNCLRDSKSIEALQKLGADVLKIPMYLPLFAHDDKGEVPVFYGAVGLYLKQVFPALRYLPSWAEKLLNAPSLLRYAASKANSTRAKGLEEMTISMLMGEEGKQKEELEKMTQWLKNNFKADIIHISNALLLGLAHKLKKDLNIPVVCSLQDEDVWVEAMPEPFRQKVWALMAEKAKDVDMFIAVSDYFSNYMQKKIQLPPTLVSTIHLGIAPDDYVFKHTAEKKDKNIGFLSRLCKENGLDILIEAFILLKKMPGNKTSRLLLTGGYTADDKAFLKQQKKKISDAGLTNAVVFIDGFNGKARIDFFRELSALSVPVRQGEAFGIYLAEAMASGVPIVQPELGAFPEIAALTDGGIIYKKNTPEALAEALNTLLNNNELLHDKSHKARKNTVEYFNIEKQSRKMLAVYEEVVKNYSTHKTH